MRLIFITHAFVFEYFEDSSPDRSLPKAASLTAEPITQRLF
jgi:hypothetical protein